MNKRMRWTVGGVAGLAVVLGGAGVAIAGSEDEAEGPDVAITGEALEAASVAALVYIDEPGAEVTDTEVGDEEGFYEVEVTLADGSEIDVHLSEGFEVLSDEAETDEAGDDD